MPLLLHPCCRPAHIALGRGGWVGGLMVPCTSGHVHGYTEGRVGPGQAQRAWPALHKCPLPPPACPALPPTDPSRSGRPAISPASTAACCRTKSEGREGRQGGRGGGHRIHTVCNVPLPGPPCLLASLPACLAPTHPPTHVCPMWQPHGSQAARQGHGAHSPAQPHHPRGLRHKSMFAPRLLTPTPRCRAL